MKVMKIFGSLYKKVLEWSLKKNAERYLCGLSFAESSFFPVPPDVMLIPMCLANQSKAFRFALLTTFLSVIGGTFGYLLGYFLIESIEPWLFDSTYSNAFENGKIWFERFGVIAVLLAGFSPIPYKIFTIAAGALALSFPGFVIASLIGRGARFFLVAGLIVYGGKKMEASIAKNIELLGWSLLIIIVCVVGYFIKVN